MELDEAREHVGHGVLYLPSAASPEDGVIAGVTETAVFVRFTGGQHAKSCRPQDLTLTVEFARAVLHFTRTWGELMADLPDVYDCTMNCPEVNAAEGLWLAVGDAATAEAIIDGHAGRDDPDDEHYQCERARNGGR